MASRAHRWPDGNTPLTGVHGGTAKAALRAVSYSKAEKRAPYERVRQDVREIIARNQEGQTTAVFVRKDRMRPKAKPARESLPVPEDGAVSRSAWACRPSGVRYVPGRKGERPMRTKDQCDAQRAALRAAQEGRCGLCAHPLAANEPFGGSLDHVIPFALGGKDGLGNLLLAHGECNGAKTNDTPTGCELVWLLAVNARLGVGPQRW